jgi:hypothetical protein
MVDKLSVKIHEQYESVLKDTSSGEDVRSKVTGFVLKLGNSEGIACVIKKGISKSLEKTLSMDETRTGEMMSKRLDDVANADIFNDIVEAQIRHFFGRMKRSIVFIFLLILLFPLTEVGIAHGYNAAKKIKLHKSTLVRA